MAHIEDFQKRMKRLLHRRIATPEPAQPEAVPTPEASSDTITSLDTGDQLWKAALDKIEKQAKLSPLLKAYKNYLLEHKSIASEGSFE